MREDTGYALAAGSRGERQGPEAGKGETGQGRGRRILRRGSKEEERLIEIREKGERKIQRL